MIPRVPHDSTHDESLAASSSFVVRHFLQKVNQHLAVLISNLKFLYGLRNYGGAPRTQGTIAKKILVTHRCEEIWFDGHDVIDCPYIRPYIHM